MFILQDYNVSVVSQWCSPLSPGTLGEFNQPPKLGLVSWVWLGMGTHAGVTLIMTERSHF